MKADQFFTSSVLPVGDSAYTPLEKENSMDPYEKTRNSLLFLLAQTGIVLENIQKMPNYVIPEECLVLKELNTNNIHSYLDKLQYRLMDKASRILVTGDLNAGKSTLCNTILRRHIVPDDQEPCTATFVEVVDSVENDGIEQVHAIHDPALYSKDDPSTFNLLKMEDLRKTVEKGNPAYPLLKVYCTDAKSKSSHYSRNSLLHNGSVDVSIIDSPGLNIDSIKTTALFSKQEEIDVIVFVVNAENHFTLSGRQFLEIATREKAFLFIIVNRCDTIQRRDRNKKEILNQIREIAPSTFGKQKDFTPDDADNLVHFVSAKTALKCYVDKEIPDDQQWIIDFENMEKCLRNFILFKRNQSKLAPAKTYLANIFSDIKLILECNLKRQENLLAELRHAVLQNKSDFEGLKSAKKKHFGQVENEITSTEEKIAIHIRSKLKEFLGEYELFMESVDWHGITSIWDYSQQLRSVVFKLSSIRLNYCVNFAEAECKKEMERIQGLFLEDVTEMETSLDKVQLQEFDMDSLAPVIPTQPMFGGAELFTDLMPSFLIGTVSMLGYRAISSGIIKMQTRYSVKIGKLVFAGFAIAGCGLLLFKLADMKRVIQKHVVESLDQHFENTQFIESNTRRITVSTRRSLQNGIFDLQRQFQRLLDQKETIFEEKKESLTKVESEIVNCDSLIKKAESLKNHLDELD